MSSGCGWRTASIWRVAINTLNKQLRTADSGWSSILGVGQGPTTPPHKNWCCYEMDTFTLECRLRVFENRVRRRKFGPKRDKVVGVEKIV